MTSIFDPKPVLLVLEGLHAGVTAGTLPDPVLVADVDGNPIVTSDQVQEAYQAHSEGDTLKALKPLVAVGDACAWSRTAGIAFGQYDDTPVICDVAGKPLLTVKQAINSAAIQVKTDVEKSKS